MVAEVMMILGEKVHSYGWYCDRMKERDLTDIEKFIMTNYNKIWQMDMRKGGNYEKKKNVKR